MESINAMHAFVKVVDAGSISGASRLLKVPKSTLSRRLSRLEDRLGAQLLVRTTRTLTLTEVGAAYYERCRQIVADIEEAEAAVKRSREVPQGTLRLTAPSQAGPETFSALISTYLERYPEVSVDFLMTNRYVNLAEEGFDVAIRAGRLTDSSLIARKLVDTGAVLVASGAYLERRGVPERPADLADHDCLIQNPHRESVTWNLSDAHAVSVSGRLYANDLSVIKEAAIAGFGVALLPRIVARDDIEAGRLMPVLEEFVVATGGIYVVYLPGRHLSPKVRAFVDLAVEHFATIESVRGG